MEIFRADILQVNKKGRLIFLAVVIVFAAILAALIFIGVIPMFFEMLGLVIFAYTLIRYYLQTKKQLLKQSIGELVISKDSISAFGERYLVDELKAIMITFSGYKSYRKTEDRSNRITDIHTGDGNFLSFHYEGKEKRFELLLSSQQHWQQLRVHVIDWYRRNIKVIESVNGSKSYGLEVLNYAQIQEFKKLISTPNQPLK